ncbi:MAG: hypothetical protein U5O15_00735 [Candidatus Krumholzibacteriota bacterium]|nr:hypothetical protein [Candidatus Krumholzibacteriota bacterium]
MNKWIKYVAGVIFAGILVTAVIKYDPHGLNDLQEFQDSSRNVVIAPSAESRVSEQDKSSETKQENKIKKYHRIGWGESLSDIAEKYYEDCQSWANIQYRVKKIQELNWSEEEIKSRDLNGDGLVDKIIYYNTIKIRE